MARTIQQIQDSIIANLVATAAAVGVIIDPGTWSNYDYRQLLTYVTAVANGTLEQLWDAFKVDVEAIVATSAPQTPLWLQNMVLNIFQYSATVPQIIKFDTTNIAPYYETVDASLRIVTQCAVIPSIFGTTKILVAKGGSTPVPLTTGTGSELNALQSFVNTLTVPGINITVSSSAADKIYVQANVTYSGQYSAIIQSTVVAAIEAFLRNIPVTGIVEENSPVGLFKITDLIRAIRAVPGVIDVELNNVNIRKNADSFPPVANNMISNNLLILNEWNSGLQGGAGYIVGETTVGSTLNDTITYTPL